MAGGPAADEVGADELLAAAVAAPLLSAGAAVAADALSCTGGTRLAGELELSVPPLQEARSTTAPTTGSTRRQGDPERAGR